MPAIFIDNTKVEDKGLLSLHELSDDYVYLDIEQKYIVKKVRISPGKDGVLILNKLEAEKIVDVYQPDSLTKKYQFYARTLKYVIE